MFWDSSALVPCLVSEPNSDQIRTLFAADRRVVIWWSTPVECASALERRIREGLFESRSAEARRRLHAIMVLAQTIVPTEEIRQLAIEMFGRHRSLGLRASDALQLAAARNLADRTDRLSTDFVCLDSRFRQAAKHEGLVLVPE